MANEKQISEFLSLYGRYSNEEKMKLNSSFEASLVKLRSSIYKGEDVVENYAHFLNERGQSMLKSATSLYEKCFKELNNIKNRNINEHQEKFIEKELVSAIERANKLIEKSEKIKKKKKKEKKIKNTSLGSYDLRVFYFI